jgi:peptide/nickel transport system substrate-binding protein
MALTQSEERAARGLGMSRRRFVRGGVAAGGGLAAAWLAACGGGEDKPASQATTAPGGQAAATQAAAAGTQAAAAPTKPTGTITVVQGVDANTLDPQFTNATPEATILYHVFDTILWRDPKTLKPVPGAAESFKSVDTTTWEFKLRPNMKFHDGTPVDAEAVKFSLDRRATETLGGKPTVPRIRRTINYDKTEVVDTLTFRIKTSKPSPILPDVMTGTPIVPPSIYQGEAADTLSRVQSRPVGSGPFKFVEWQRDQRLVVEVNPDHWRKDLAFERIIFRPVGETSTRILQLKNGEADVIVNVPPDNVADIDKSEKARISSVEGLRKIFVGIRTEKHPALADKRVRQALNHAVNFDAINRALLDGKGKRMKTYFNPPHEPPDAKAYEYNVNRAKELLAQAGYANGFNVEMHAPTGRYIKDKEIAQAIAQDLDKVGIKVDLKILEWSVYAGQELTKASGGPPSGLYFVGLGAPVNGQDEAFFFHKDYQLNFTDWKHDEYHALFDKLSVELDEKKFQEIINQMHKILWDEVPWIGIYNQVDFYGVSRKLLWDARADERIAMFEAKWKA